MSLVSHKVIFIENETVLLCVTMRVRTTVFAATNYNLGHNILELYNVLAQIRLTTSKTKRGIEYSELGIQVASRIAERLKI